MQRVSELFKQAKGSYLRGNFGKLREKLYFQDFIFQQDHAPANKSKIVSNFSD